jgi:hypothetical protein
MKNNVIQFDSSQAAGPATKIATSFHENWRRNQVRKLLMRAIKEEGILVQAQIAFEWWPSLLTCSVDLCQHVGTQVCISGGKPIAYATVFRAVRAFEKCLANSKNVEKSAAEFLNEILNLADEVSQYMIFVEHKDGRTCCWAPFKQSYSDWLRENDDVQNVQITHASFVFDDEYSVARRRLATLTMTDGDFGLVFALRGVK